MERTDFMHDAEHHAGPVASGRRTALASQDQESGGVDRIVLNVALENLQPVSLGRERTGNRGGLSIRAHQFGGPRGGGAFDDLDLGQVFLNPAPALPQRLRGCIWVREIVGRVRRANGSWVNVRLWTDLWDERKHPAQELLALYAQRWEIELGTRELKLDLRGTVLLQSHTVETAAQEILAAVLGMAVLSQARLVAAASGEVGPLRISFGQTLLLVRSLWWLVAMGQGILSARQVLALTERTMEWIGAQALPKRRARSCPRAVRQPVGGWPRLLANSYQHGPVQYEVLPISPV